MRRLIKRLFRWAAVGVLAYCTLNLCTGYSQVLLKRSINNQISYISQELQKGAGETLQQAFPEGMTFGHAIFSLSIIEARPSAVLSDQESAILIDHSILQLISEKNTQVYDKTLVPTYGAFYNGWTNFILKKYRESNSYEYSSIQRTVNKAYEDISKRIVDAQEEQVHLLDTYHSSIWPADNLMCIASLDTSHYNLQKAWYHNLIDSSDNHRGLINHDAFQPKISRGSSLALAIYATSQFDNEPARKQNSIFYDNYLRRLLGLDLIKEYENGGEMDADSGPILFNIGSVATIMNIKTQHSVNNLQLRLTWGFLNMLGLPLNLNGEKCYLFEQELMFDIFMLWTSVSLLD